MTLSTNSHLSALSAFGKKMGVIAHNVANGYTEAFKRSRALLIEGPNQSVHVEISRSGSPGYPGVDSPNNSTDGKEPSNVDLAEEIPQAILVHNGYSANLKAIKTRDEMIGMVLDILG
jgi:flagellar hook protein FlgE